MDIHMITAFKGGSGKTLIALALLSYFGGRAASSGGESKIVWAVDLNTTNPNFYEILSSGDKFRMSSTLEEGMWYVEKGFSRVPSFTLSIARPNRRFQLLQGPVALWESLGKILSMATSQNQNVYVVVDTDLNAPNLVQGMTEEELKEQVKRRIGENNLFVWSIWTPHYLAEVDTFDKLIKTEEALRGVLGERFRLIHVINSYLFSRRTITLRALGWKRSTEYRSIEIAEPSKAVLVSDLLQKLRGARGGELPPAEKVIETLEQAYGKRLPCNIISVDKQESLIGHNYITSLRNKDSIRTVEDEIHRIVFDVSEALKTIERGEAAE